MKAWTAILRALAAVAVVAYPVFVWLGLSSGSARHVALVLLLVMAPAFAMRLRHSAREELRGLAAVPLAIVAVLATAALLDTSGLILVAPVATNTVLLATFGATLRRGSVPMIERFARLQKKPLNEDQQAWCRGWTWIWCGFFVLNGGTALVLALAAPMAWWAFYNGLLCYGLIGLLLTLEWVLRRRRFPELRQREVKA